LEKHYEEIRKGKLPEMKTLGNFTEFETVYQNFSKHIPDELDQITERMIIHQKERMERKQYGTPLYEFVEKDLPDEVTDYQYQFIKDPKKLLTTYPDPSTNIIEESTYLRHPIYNAQEVFQIQKKLKHNPEYARVTLIDTSGARDHDRDVLIKDFDGSIRTPSWDERVSLFYQQRNRTSLDKLYLLMDGKYETPRFTFKPRDPQSWKPRKSFIEIFDNYLKELYSEEKFLKDVYARYQTVRKGRKGSIRTIKEARQKRDEKLEKKLRDRQKLVNEWKLDDENEVKQQKQ